ncbi:MAG: thiosulfate/3-mercaptopyruvate sulfurtransferase [Thermoproteota archaeon]|jgi:thiosulfate/3-mercaptopyruvate sulfurtransferase
MEFTNPEYLVSTEWLADHFDRPDVRVLDVTAKLTSKLENRAEAECYQDSHIPGSLFFDVPAGKGVLSSQEDVLPWMWPSPDEVVATLAAVGVGPETKVVLVARTPREGIDSGTMWCTRAWWTLHHYGVDCAILHGGIERWEAEGRPLTDTASTIPEAAPFVPIPGWESARATKDDVLAAVQGHACLVDALPADSFDGTGTSYGPRSGHITGAVNVPYRSLIEAETAAFVGPASMHERLAEAGLLGTPKVITYCGGAIAATVDAFALALFDKTDVAVYDGSLMEWTKDAELPMTDPSAGNAAVTPAD